MTSISKLLVLSSFAVLNFLVADAYADSIVNVTIRNFFVDRGDVKLTISQYGGKHIKYFNEFCPQPKYFPVRKSPCIFTVKLPTGKYRVVSTLSKIDANDRYGLYSLADVSYVKGKYFNGVRIELSLGRDGISVSGAKILVIP